MLYFVFSHEQGEHAQSFQVQGVLPSGVSKPQREVWYWWPGLFGKKTASGELTFPAPTFCSCLLPLLFLGISSVPVVGWVGSAQRSPRLNSVQLSFSHVYIIIQLAASIGLLGVLRHPPVERNAMVFPTSDLPSYMNHQSFKTGLVWM